VVDHSPHQSKDEALSPATTAGTCGMCYKLTKIVNDNSRVINKLETPLTDDARVIIYDHHMFIVPATEESKGRENAC
jgi:hypothetical protein